MHKIFDSMVSFKNKLLFSAFLILAISSICVNCGNIRSSERYPVPSEKLPVPSESFPTPAVEPRGLFNSPSAETRHVKAETYFQNGRFQPLHVGVPFPISVHTDIVRNGFIKVTLNAVNRVDYEITYNNADGWVSNVRPIGQTQHTGAPDHMAAEAKIKNIIAKCQQIAFEKDGRIQFITDSGSSRISFDRHSGPSHPGFQSHPASALYPASSGSGYGSNTFAGVQTRQVVPETYHLNGRFQPLHVGAAFPISVDTDIVRNGLARVTLKAVNRINYEITYNNVDGSVINVRHIDQTQHTGTPDQMDAEAKIKNIIANCKQIVSDNNGRVQFITDNGSTRISFDPVRPRHLAAVESRHVVPETYHQNGRSQPLHTSHPFPITVDTDVVRGGFVKVTLKAVNTIGYEITYNNADGWVSNVRPIGQSQHTGTPDQMAAEAKVKNIIANCQQIAFEKDGRIQFITDNGSSRVSFNRPSHPQFTAPSPAFGYQHHPSFPAAQLSPVHSGFGAGAGYGAGSNTFTGVQSRRVVPETYHQNGRFQALHAGAPFPIAVDTHVVRGGFIKVTLKAVNTIDYEITYNNADGWVSNVRPIGQSQHTGTPDQMAAEAKLKHIIANTQQIAFEKDGRIQFIMDNGSTRVTFK